MGTAARDIIPLPNWRGLYDAGVFPNGSTYVEGLNLKEIEWAGRNYHAFFDYVHDPAAPEPVWLGSLLTHKRDASGPLYMRNRYFDPTSGRFTQEDPIGIAGGLNLYGFGGGDPVSFGDPFGLCADHLYRRRGALGSWGSAGGRAPVGSAATSTPASSAWSRNWHGGKAEPGPAGEDHAQQGQGSGPGVQCLPGGRKPVRLRPRHGHGGARWALQQIAAMQHGRRGMTSRIVLAAAVALSACAPPRAPDMGEDPVLATGRRLIGLAGYVDSHGRRLGALPPSLDPVVADSPAVRERTVDAWGRTVRYRVDGTAFELKSAGMDASFETADDVVVTGRLGRFLPCEVRDERRAFGYDDVAPPCSAPLPVLALCPALERADELEERLPPLADPVAATGRRLVALSRRMDWYARRVGGPPPGLRAAFGFRGPVDGWGRQIVYTPGGATFEMRSAGPDGVPQTGDDVVVASGAGRTIPCEYRSGNEARRCDMPPPSCGGAAR